MTTEKWVQCTEELAENPHKVKEWRNIRKWPLRFIAYDKENISSIIVRDKDGRLDEYEIISVQCLIEVPIQERFITFYESDSVAGSFYPSLELAKQHKGKDCTRILKLTFDGENFQVEPVWIKEST